jgi:hypothetical protein
MMDQERFRLYEAAVQEPVHEVTFYQRAFKDAHQRAPLVLREDFSGTAAISRAWVQASPAHRAIAVDLDADALTYAGAQPLPAEARGRLTLVQADVRTVTTPAIDVVGVGNFSINELGDRRALVDYLASVHAALADEGVVVLDVMGGPERQVDARTERRRCRGFEVEWTQSRFDPISGRGRFSLSFIKDGGARLDQAFVYDWRLWTLPELRDTMADAGFAESVVYWPGDDTKRGGHQGMYKRKREAAAVTSFVAYLVGIKGPRSRCAPQSERR